MPEEIIDDSSAFNEVSHLTPEQEANLIKENEAKMLTKIQEMFIQEGGDISADFNKSNKRQIDTNIQRTIINHINEHFSQTCVTMDDVFTFLATKDLHLNVIPSKKEYGKYGFKIMILQSINESEFTINVKTNLEINPK